MLQHQCCCTTPPESYTLLDQQTVTTPIGINIFISALEGFTIFFVSGVEFISVVHELQCRPMSWWLVSACLSMLAALWIPRSAVQGSWRKRHWMRRLIVLSLVVAASSIHALHSNFEISMTILLIVPLMAKWWNCYGVGIKFRLCLLSLSMASVLYFSYSMIGNHKLDEVAVMIAVWTVCYMGCVRGWIWLRATLSDSAR